MTPEEQERYDRAVAREAAERAGAPQFPNDLTKLPAKAAEAGAAAKTAIDQYLDPANAQSTNSVLAPKTIDTEKFIQRLAQNAARTLGGNFTPEITKLRTTLGLENDKPAEEPSLGRKVGNATLSGAIGALSARSLPWKWMKAGVVGMEALRGDPVESAANLAVSQGVSKLLTPTKVAGALSGGTGPARTAKFAATELAGQAISQNMASNIETALGQKPKQRELTWPDYVLSATTGALSSHVMGSLLKREAYAAETGMKNVADLVGVDIDAARDPLNKQLTRTSVGFMQDAVKRSKNVAVVLEDAQSEVSKVEREMARVKVQFQQERAAAQAKLAAEVRAANEGVLAGKYKSLDDLEADYIARRLPYEEKLTKLEQSLAQQEHDMGLKGATDNAAMYQTVANKRSSLEVARQRRLEAEYELKNAESPEDAEALKGTIQAMKLKENSLRAEMDIQLLTGKKLSAIDRRTLSELSEPLQKQILESKTAIDRLNYEQRAAKGAFTRASDIEAKRVRGFLPEPPNIETGKKLIADIRQNQANTLLKMKADLGIKQDMLRRYQQASSQDQGVFQAMQSYAKTNSELGKELGISPLHGALDAQSYFARLYKNAMNRLGNWDFDTGAQAGRRISSLVDVLSRKGDTAGLDSFRAIFLRDLIHASTESSTGGYTGIKTALESVGGFDTLRRVATAGQNYSKAQADELMKGLVATIDNLESLYYFPRENSVHRGIGRMLDYIVYWGARGLGGQGTAAAAALGMAGMRKLSVEDIILTAVKRPKDVHKLVETIRDKGPESLVKGVPAINMLSDLVNQFSRSPQDEHNWQVDPTSFKTWRRMTSIFNPDFQDEIKIGAPYSKEEVNRWFPGSEPATRK
jgi:hypothetical protein